MKNLIVILSLLLCQQAFAQIVDIPDANFKNALIALGVDTNNDGEIQESEALGVDSLNLYQKQISSLEGIKYFTNLKNLDCTANQLITLDIQGLKKLQKLNCNKNLIINIDLLGLTGLQELSCSQNQLTSLNLNGLTNLTFLSCYINQLTSLVVNNLSNLKLLKCNANKLTSLDVQGLTNLEQLQCENNLLTSLNVSGLVNLQWFACSNNLLTSLNVSGLLSLQNLDCGLNNISDLNISGLINLYSLYCYNNDLTSINLKGTSNLLFLLCNNNQLDILDIQEQVHLQNLNCENNQLKSLIIKDGRKIINLTFDNNPDLKYICCDDFEIEDLKNAALKNGITNCSINSYCNFNFGGTNYIVKGETKLDLDNNGCDSTDSAYPNLKFLISDGIISGNILPINTAKYLIPFQAGTYTLTPLIENQKYFQISPKSKTVTFPDEGDSLVQNFCITPNGIHKDVNIIILPTTPAKPGFNVTYKIVYKNQGNQTESGKINFFFDDAIIDYVNSEVSPDSQSTGILSWNFTDLKPIETRSFNLVLNIHGQMETSPVNVDDILTYQANISIVDIDEAPLDNIFELNQTVVGSFDPNDKTCLEGNTIKPTMVGEYIHYLIRFENTGTYAAENVVVKDVIDASVFDVQSLQITDASHKMFTRINGNVVEFIFEDIQLPIDDANNDGYVAFEIKTRPSLVLGDVLKNKAEIYFDYNLPIITNEAQTLVKNGVRTTEAKELAIDFYPNPAKGHVKFLINDQIEKAQIYDLNGKILRSASINNNELNVQELQSGTYMVRLFTKNNVYVAKVVKM